MADIKGAFAKVFKTAFPFIGTAATIFGGPAVGGLVTKVGQALGLNNSIDPANPPTLEDLGTAYLNATPDQIAAAMKIEADYKTQMQSLGFQNAVDMEKLAVEDRENARAREIAIRDYTPEIGLYLLMLIFGYALHWLFRYPIPTDNRALIYTMLGSLGTLLVTAATYFYGTTRGSEQKTQLLAQAPPVPVKK